MNTLDSLRMVLAWVIAYLKFVLWTLRARPRDSRGRVTVGDLSLFFRRYGAGEPVLLLHGGFSFSEMWAGQVPALSASYEVTAVDSPGHGRSTLGSDPLTYRGMARDFAALIEELGLGQVHLVGWSDGGCVSLALALQRPELVRSMTLLGTPFNFDNYAPGAVEAIADFLAPGSPELRGMRVMNLLMSPEPGRWREFIEKMTEMWTHLPDFTIEELGGINVPTLVIGCDRDEFLSQGADPLRVFKETADAIPGAMLAVIRGGTHSVNVEKPAELNRVLLDFLSSVPASS